MEEIEITKLSLSDGRSIGNGWQELWKKAILNCFLQVDAEIGGVHRGSNGSDSDASEVFQESIAPETVGSTAVVAILCSTHIVVANCGDSRAVLCRGKVPMPLSVDHKVRHVFVVLHLFIGVQNGDGFPKRLIFIYLYAVFSQIEKMNMQG